MASGAQLSSEWSRAITEASKALDKCDDKFTTSVGSIGLRYMSGKIQYKVQGQRWEELATSSSKLEFSVVNLFRQGIIVAEGDGRRGSRAATGRRDEVVKKATMVLEATAVQAGSKALTEQQVTSTLRKMLAALTDHTGEPHGQSLRSKFDVGAYTFYLKEWLSPDGNTNRVRLIKPQP